MRFTRIPLAVAVTGAFLLAGCGSDDTAGTASAEAGPNGTVAPTMALSEEATKRLSAEKEVAACMKQKGFQYEVPPVHEESFVFAEYIGTAGLLRTDDELRKYRQKYGFGIYSVFVYPDDPMVKRPDVDPDRNPNNAIRAALDPPRRKAYDAAYMSDPKAGRRGQGCADIAYAKYFVSTDPDVQAGQKRAYEQYRTDPQVVTAAQKYADCLVAKGYKVASAEPGKVEEGVPALIRATTHGAPEVPIAEAKAQLPKEIAASLADVDCRGDYARITRTKYAKVVSAGNGIN